MTAPLLYCRKCGTRMPSDSLFCPACGVAQAGTEQAFTNQPEQNPALLGTGRLPAGLLLTRRYRLVQAVGQGGMGAVYAAQDTQLGDRLVAVKEMSLRRLAPQEVPQAVAQFQQEAYLLASLHHPNLPVIYEYFQEDERWYLVMSFIEGQTLQAVLDAAPEKKLPVSEVVLIGMELCEALDYLHTHNPQIIFRDLKPLNIMLTPKGHICLIDFGIARHFKQDQTKDTAYYYSAGYAPPEQQYGQSQTGPRSDIYSLGATLHQMASGHYPGNRPFQFAPLQSLDPAFPAWLAQLIAQMLKMEEKDRPTSAVEVKAQLLHAGQTDLTRATPGFPLPPTVQAFPSPTAVFPATLPVSTPAGSLAFPSQPLIAKPGAIGVLCTFNGHTKDVPIVALGADGKIMASAGLDQTVRLWNVQTGQILPLPPEAEKAVDPLCMALSADGGTLAYTYKSPERYGRNAGCHIWNVRNAQFVGTGNVKGFLHQPYHISLSADGLVFACHSEGHTDSYRRLESGENVKIYDLHMNMEKPRRYCHVRNIDGLALCPNGLTLATGDGSKTRYQASSFIWVENTQTGDRFETNTTLGRKSESEMISCLAFNADGSLLASGSLDGSVKLWNVQRKNLKLLHTLPCATKSIALTHDGLLLVSVRYGDKSILLWDTKTGKLLGTLQSPTGTVSSIALSADGRVLAGGCSDGTIHIWGVKG